MSLKLSIGVEFSNFYMFGYTLHKWAIVVMNLKAIPSSEFKVVQYLLVYSVRSVIIYDFDVRGYFFCVKRHTTID